MSNAARRAPTQRGSRVEYSQVRNPSGFDDSSDESDSDTDDLIRKEVRSQQRMKKKQDQHLDQLNASVLRLGDMSKSISNELETQAVMLDDLDDDISKAQTQMDFVNRKTKELIKQSGGCKWFCIIVVLCCIILALMLIIIMGA
eukprot:g4448.t1